jgi:hypothetical protein
MSSRRYWPSQVSARSMAGVHQRVVDGGFGLGIHKPCGARRWDSRWIRGWRNFGENGWSGLSRGGWGLADCSAGGYRHFKQTFFNLQPFQAGNQVVPLTILCRKPGIRGADPLDPLSETRTCSHDISLVSLRRARFFCQSARTAHFTVRGEKAERQPSLLRFERANDRRPARGGSTSCP